MSKSAAKVSSQEIYAAEERGYIRGVAWAIAMTTRWQTDSEVLFKESGVSLKDFSSAGVNSADLRTIKKLARKMRKPE